MARGGLSIFNSLKSAIHKGVVSIAEAFVMNNAKKNSKKKNTSSSSSSILPKSKFAINFANLFNLVGITRADNFYRCDYDLEDIKNAIETDSYLKVAVQKYKQLFFKAGYTYKSKNDDAIVYLQKRFRIMGYCTDQSMDILFREVSGDLVAYSNAFLIKTRVKNVPFINAKGITKNGMPVGGYFRVDPSSIQVQYDDDGKLKSYKQRTNAGKEKIFSPEDVIHFTFDRDPGSIWGVPRWIAALEDIRLLRKIEGNVLALIYRFAMPLYQMMIGLVQSGMGGTEAEIKDARRELERAPMDGVLITNERTQIKAVGAEGNALDVSTYLSYYENRVFTAINVSQAMMGRGGSKQDADSMEEQVHNTVKDNQIMFGFQFKEKMINELLLEGGFNPIIDEDDIVELEFNEINLDTKVKMENHEINKFEKNAITFEELRQHLGEKKDDVDESRLYANMISQKNALEQIQVTNDGAMSLVKLQGDLAADAAEKAAETNVETGVANEQPVAAKTSIKTSGYTKKNTGNGKLKGTASKTKTVSTNDSPKNQHGTFSAKVKESMKKENFADRMCNIYEDMRNDIIGSPKKTDMVLQLYEQKLHTQLTARMHESGGRGSKASFIDNGKKENKSVPLSFDSSLIKNYTKTVLSELFGDIKKKVGNNTDRIDLEQSIDSMKYRLKFLTNFVENKSFWYSYTKTCAYQGIKQVQINCEESSTHHKDHHKMIDTKDFDVNDIPGFSSYCHCYITPVKQK